MKEIQCYLPHAKGNFKIIYFPLFFKKALKFYYEVGTIVGPDGTMKNKTFSSWILRGGKESPNSIMPVHTELQVVV